jgi:hypothetical protein
MKITAALRRDYAYEVVNELYIGKAKSEAGSYEDLAVRCLGLIFNDAELEAFRAMPKGLVNEITTLSYNSSLAVCFCAKKHEMAHFSAIAANITDNYFLCNISSGRAVVHLTKSFAMPMPFFLHSGSPMSRSVSLPMTDYYLSNSFPHLSQARKEKLKAILGPLGRSFERPTYFMNKAEVDYRKIVTALEQVPTTERLEKEDPALYADFMDRTKLTKGGLPALTVDYSPITKMLAEVNKFQKASVAVLAHP